MKKKLIVLLVVLVVSVLAFAGCTSEKVYKRNVADFDALEVAMGDAMKYPEFTLKGKNAKDEPYKFFNPDDFKDAVTIDPMYQANEIVLLYIPPITGADVEALAGKFDTKAYRYSIKITMNNTDYSPVMEKGVIELYVHGTDYSKLADADPKAVGNVKLVPVADRKAKLEKDNAGDKKKLDKNGESAYFMSEIKEVNGKDVYYFENKMDSQVIRYFTIGDSQSYEITACIRVDGKLKGDAVKTAYDELLAFAKTNVDAFVETMTK